MLQRSEKETNWTKTELYKIRKHLETKNLVTNIRMADTNKTEEDLLDYLLEDNGLRVQT
jgi:hypothetical protein